ncbi:MAG: peptide chain release factor N(5)-glutamine methyltransferase [Clostridia bacterium]|nr:peptide chain release factor N(5)-glutamine methyltransferase [Clostridia bacterium]
MTIFEAYNSTKKRLEAVGIKDYVFEAKQIIMHVTGLKAAQILTDYNNQLTQFQENNLIALIHQREVHYPLQYIFGSWDFYGRPFKVGVGVLIPRSDTETVVEQSLEILKNTESPKVLDLCAGSGCIGITIDLEISDAKVTMIEKFDEALRYATENITLNNSSATVLKGDIFEKPQFENEIFDLIVSNPPYIPQNEMKYCSHEVKFEPETALLAEDEGLEFYKAIIKNYTPCLKVGGSFCFEVGFKQAEKVSELLNQNGFKDIKIKNDLNGIGRAVSGTK